MMEFVDELSTFYLRLSRERLKYNAKSQSIFLESLRVWAVVIAPIMPFLSELIYQNLGGELPSVHLERWPEITAMDEHAQTEAETLVAGVKLMKAILAAGQAERKRLGIKVRQPLSQLKIAMKPNQSELVQQNQQWMEVIKSELNVKKVTWVAEQGELRVEYDTELTPELETEGQARELIRTINGERKKRQLAADAPWEYEVSAIPEGWQEKIEKKTGTKLKLVIT
jgi:isoleucyl-tRNA synthetase